MVTTIAILVFLVIILLLVSLLLFAKQALIPQKDVPVDVNAGERRLSVASGFSLLASLSANGVFLPSACGGGGTCGLCRCRVVSGGGGILPTEVGFFTRRQQQERWRLACQVKVRESLAVKIPEEILGIKQWECEVASNRNVATFIKELVVKLPEGQALGFKSGGYIQVSVPACEVDFARDVEVAPEFRADWDRMKIWDLKMNNPAPTFRAYSMASYPAEGSIIMLNVRIATPPWSREQGFAGVSPGVCSSYLFSRKPGDRVTISGPYGEFFLRDTQSEMMFIGGGAGMAPMRSHIFHLFRTLKTGRKVTFWYGARSLREVFYEEQFRAIEKRHPNFRFTIALSDPQPDDRWDGATGFIHRVIYDQYLRQHEAPEDVEYYLCGPPMMTAATTKMLYELGVPDEMVMFDNFGA